MLPETNVSLPNSCCFGFWWYFDDWIRQVKVGGNFKPNAGYIILVMVDVVLANATKEKKNEQNDRKWIWYERDSTFKLLPIKFSWHCSKGNETLVLHSNVECSVADFGHGCVWWCYINLSVVLGNGCFRLKSSKSLNT